MYLGIIELRFDVERLHDLELEKLPEVKLLPVRRGVGDLTHKNMGTQLLHLKASK